MLAEAGWKTMQVFQTNCMALRAVAPQSAASGLWGRAHPTFWRETMYTMKSASRALPAQVAPLALALAACVGVPQTGHAQSVIVPAGTTLTVDPGSPYEGHVFSVRGTLNLNGVSVGSVAASGGRRQCDGHDHYQQ